MEMLQFLFVSPDCSLYRNATAFRVLVLYPITLLDWFISSNKLFWWGKEGPLGFFLYVIISSTKKDHFISPSLTRKLFLLLFA